MQSFATVAFTLGIHEILDIAVRYVVVHNYSRLVLSIVEEVQFVAALSHVMNVLAMQGVVGRTRE